ncbi:MurR/RpiR family transcriptional regulator [Paenibacillus sp. CF384]|uniref:MurR/RpiR family transcriptional regulator n=1 Tax=Paenibacillus sp. CF384 TaxID=1884382 RepID=UPI00089BB4D0|nr:MurR/RpiR family transcriptional regulator [Paenibacillus sp. CF384]SDX92572.1 transcriptional regulator, RpiR family [Paenibacillus sp. CF384]
MKPWLANQDSFTPSERKLADYIVKYEYRLSFQTERDIADLLQVSIATVSRFWRKIGYANFKAYKLELADKVDAFPTPAEKLRSMLEDPVEDIVVKMLSREIGYVQQTLQRLDRVAFDHAVQTLGKAKRVYVYGSGPSASLCELLRFRLNRFGKTVIVLPRSGSELFEALVHATAEDAFVVFGFFRQSPEIKVIQEVVRGLGSEMVLFTDLTSSAMIDATTCVLYVDRGESGQFHSLTAPVALLDALIVAMAQQEQASVDQLNKLYELRKRYSDILPH